MSLREDYFRWLYGRVDGGRRSYQELSRYLDRLHFYWTVPNDGNREEDAIREREIFVDQISHGLSGKKEQLFLTEPVSVFEVICALVKRFDYNVADFNSSNRLHRWFHEFLDNLELADLTDDRFTNDSKARVDHVIKILLDRKYDRYGNGSFFPLRNFPGKKMEKIEVWYQMMYYLAENYP